MKLLYIILTTSFTIVFACYEDPTTCDERVFDRDSFVCVCDAEYCDVIGDVSLPPHGGYKRVVSSRDKYRFAIETGTEDNSPKGEVVVHIDYETEYQTMLGFGGAFSDSTGITITTLSKKAQDQLLRSYFSGDGIEYNLCRIPIAGTDFSTHPYSYDENEGDVTLEHFSLVKEDHEYKIPLIRRANELAKQEIRYFGSPWSPPSWMKENGQLNGKGGLLKGMWDPYSNYLIKFIEEYKNQNITLWGLTTINEPLAGFQDWIWNACAWSAEDMRDWIKTSLGPALDKANLAHLKVMVYEHGRDKLPEYPATILRDEKANKYVDGIALHWYSDSYVGPEVLSELRNEFKDKFLLYTEACEGFESKPGDRVQFGSWERAENYSSNIIENINHYSTGWVDWNMALDLEGGPSWAKNFVDSPILINKKEDEFYKQPMFYAMGHFSKFVVPGSKRLGVRLDDPANDLRATAFRSPKHDSFVLVLLNRGDEAKTVSVRSPGDKFFNLVLSPKSLESILFSSNVTRS